MTGTLPASVWAVRSLRNQAMNNWKKHVFGLLKIVIPLAIIVWLLARIPEDKIRELTSDWQERNWSLLVAAFAISTAAVCITFVRWYLLVRALGIPFRMRDAFRLGFLGYLLNFVSIGSVGGDLFKAFFIAHERPGRRTEAVATVVVDRMIGLYALLVVTSVAILLGGVGRATTEVTIITRSTFLATGIGGIVILMIMVPGFTSGAVSEFLSGLPKVGPIFARLIRAVRMYRRSPGVLAAIGAMSLLVHAMFAAAIFMTASALAHDKSVPTLAEHCIIVPLSMVAGALPISPNGLGTFELAMEVFYEHVPTQKSAVPGTLIALAFRLITIAIAMVGVVYYWTCRREVREILEEAKHAGEDERDNDEIAEHGESSKDEHIVSRR